MKNYVIAWAPENLKTANFPFGNYHMVSLHDVILMLQMSYLLLDSIY